MSLSRVIKELEDQVVLNAKEAYADTDYYVYNKLVEQRLWKCWPRDNVSGLLVRVININSRSDGMISSKIGGGKVRYDVRFTGELLNPQVGDNIQITIKRVNKAGLFGTAGPSFMVSGSEEKSIRALIPGKNLEGKETEIYAQGQEIIGTIEAIQLAQEKTISVICSIHYFRPLDDLIGHYLLSSSEMDISDIDVQYTNKLPLTDEVIMKGLDELENLIQREKIGEQDMMWNQVRSVTDALNMLYPTKQDKKGLVISGSGPGTKILHWPQAVPYLSYTYDGKDEVLTPLSRAFYKGLEMYNQFSLIKPGQKITAAMMAEGPGGFIMALFYYMTRVNANIAESMVYGITLYEKDSHLNFNKKVTDLPLKVDLSKGSGDLTDINVAKEYINKVGRGKADLCTADGGINSDYESQEQESANLILSEIAISLAVQKTGGTFIIKLFGITTTAMLEMVALLTQVYTDTVLYKPSNSRMGNREIYLVCVGYKGLADNVVDDLLNALSARKANKYIGKIFKDKSQFSSEYIANILSYTEKSNTIQSDHINDTLRLINWIKMQRSQDTTRYLLDMYNEKQIEYAIDWCSRFNTGINETYVSK